MRTNLLNKHKCPRCGGHSFKLRTLQKSWEIRDGDITCLNCSVRYGIEDGIVDLLTTSEGLESEMSGWSKMARCEGWSNPSDEYILELPRPKKSNEGLQWERHAGNFFFMLDKLKPLENKKVLDLGAGRCWSSRYLAKEGADVVAVDIVKDRSVGLLAAEVLMRHDETYFERVLADMNNLPFVDETFNIVFFSGALHHTNDLFKTLSETKRVLKRGGLLAMTNESCGGIFTDELIGKTTEYGVNEHTYHYTRYVSYLKQLDFKITTFNEYDFYKKNWLAQKLLELPCALNRYLRATVFVAIAERN